MDDDFHEWYHDGNFLVCRKCGASTLDQTVDLDAEVVMTPYGQIRPANLFERGITCSEVVIRKVMEG